MVAIAVQKAHHGRGSQAVKLGAAIMRCHAIGGQGIGSYHDDPQGSGHVLRKQLCQTRFYLQTGTPTLAKRG